MFTTEQEGFIMRHSMKLIRQQQGGFVTMIVILLVVVIAVVAFACWRVASQS